MKKFHRWRKNFGVQILQEKLRSRKRESSHKSYKLRHLFLFFFFFLGGGEDFPTYKSVSICNDYRVYDIFRIGVKFSSWGKNSLGGVKSTR